MRKFFQTYHLKLERAKVLKADGQTAIAKFLLKEIVGSEEESPELTFEESRIETKIQAHNLLAEMEQNIQPAYGHLQKVSYTFYKKVSEIFSEDIKKNQAIFSTFSDRWTKKMVQKERLAANDFSSE